MKVDFPQPESAARPMMMGVSPSFNASREELERRLVGMKEVVVKAEAVTAARAPTVIESFMVE